MPDGPSQHYFSKQTDGWDAPGAENHLRICSQPLQTINRGGKPPDVTFSKLNEKDK